MSFSLSCLMAAFLVVIPLGQSQLGPELKQPPEIDFTASTGIEQFIAKYAPLVVKDYRSDPNGIVILNITTRMYCWIPGPPNTGCTVPAATFKMHPTVPALIRLCNGLQGLGAEILNVSYVQYMGYTPYKDQDVVNLHTHGLHVNPSEDNVVTRWQNPFCPSGTTPAQGRDCITPNGNRDNYQCQLYNFTLPQYHYPGSHWWHTHQHGSVTFQVAGGMFGPIQVVPFDEQTYAPVMNSSWFMVNYVLLKDGPCVCPTDTSSCTANDAQTPGVSPRCRLHPDGKLWKSFGRQNNRAGFPIIPRCMLWCLYTKADRDASGLNMDAYVNINYNDSSGLLRTYLVNGQYQPTKTLEVGKWHRFRIVMTTLQFMFLKVPPVSDCDSFLLGQDGIDFASSTSGVLGATGPRNITAKPYFGTIVMPIGGRADVAIRCRNNGTFKLWALYAQIANKAGPTFTASPMFSEENRQALYELSQSSSDCLGGSNLANPLAYTMPTAQSDIMLADINVVGPSMSGAQPAAPVLNNPPYSSCPYLADTRPQAVPTAFTVDVSENHEGNTSMQTPNIVFPARPFQSNTQTVTNFTGFPHMATGMNNLSYEEHEPLFSFETSRVHEWTVFIRYHPFHHHTWPYQVQSEFPNWLERQDGNTTLIDSSGWFVKGGDWRDVVGLYGSLIVRVNYVAQGPLAYDILNNKLVIHCHFVFHEDFGMMQWFNMSQNAVPPLSYTPPLALERFTLNNTNKPATDAINRLCATITNTTSAALPANPLLFITGKTIVNSTVLNAAFGLELGRIGSVNPLFYAIFSGTSRPNIHNFYVNYGVSATPQPKCGNDVGIALRLQVFRQTSSQTDHSYQAIPVDINPPHVEVPDVCAPALNVKCELITEATRGIVFDYRVFCTFDLSSVPPAGCGSVAQFANVFNSVATTGLTTRGFSWTYGEGIGSSQFPMYTNANVQSCPMEFSVIPPQSVFGGTTATQTTCDYGYFNLVGTTQTTYTFSICDQFSFFPTRAPTLPSSGTTPSPTKSPIQPGSDAPSRAVGLSIVFGIALAAFGY